MIANPNYYYGITSVYNGLTRLYPGLILITKTPLFLKGKIPPGKIIIYIEGTYSSIIESISKILILKFGGKSSHEIVVSSFLRSSFYQLADFGIQDVELLHLPSDQTFNLSDDLKTTNYYKLLCDNRIIEKINHGITNKSYPKNILERIKKNITRYETVNKKSY